MNIIKYIKSLFIKEKIEQVYCKACKQNVDCYLYNKKLKKHIIGVSRNKKGMSLTLYCDGDEI